jgi:hypothetical protein
MEPTFGWTLLSPEAIRRAEARLREDSKGVRDEIGFLFLHQAYADRFFPGTSVQQTRLRYALFVPWIYQKVAELDSKRRRQQPIEKIILEEEVRLTGKLLNSGETDGVIGRMVYEQRRASSQPATMVYWSALSNWGLLRRLEDGSGPSRASVHRMLAAGWRQTQVHDDDGVPIEEAHSLFAKLPPVPKGWQTHGEPVAFRLLADEQVFMRKQLLTTRRSGSEEPSLLARLSGTPECVRNASVPWYKAIRSAADSADKAAMDRARRAASLAAIGRAVYAALVETLREQRDGLSTSDRHRSSLAEIVKGHRDEALDLELESVREDGPGLPGLFIQVLEQTQKWLSRADGPKSLLDLYASMEQKRKGNRARLAPTPMGRQRRAEWDNEKHPLGEPLHYRWSNVKRMLLDLEDHD